MPELFSPDLISTLLGAIAPFSIGLGVTFAVAELVFQWFMRIAFGGRHAETY